MPNQTPHTPTPGFQIKPPVITKELQRLVEENKKLIKTALPAMEENERRREEEKLKQQNQLPDYTEVAGLKVLNQDLDKPQCPEVKLLKKGQKYKKCCCYKLEHEGQTYYQYDFRGALKEAKFRGIEILSDYDWTKLEEELGVDGLKNLLGLKEQKDYKGHCNDGTRWNFGDFVYYWSSSVFSPSFLWIRSLVYYDNSINRSSNNEANAFSVRCRLKD
ncbi:hypothetical protein M0P65_04260 [Candidatus Gracilibacteria bacterium]|nr:hypothetical protein [Candidatus Gracilibacteria bacterium]